MDFTPRRRWYIIRSNELAKVQAMLAEIGVTHDVEEDLLEVKLSGDQLINLLDWAALEGFEFTLSIM